MSGDNREARSLMEQAKKTSERFFPFGKGKYEQAAEMYTRAGNLFKASKNCLRPFHTFIRGFCVCFETHVFALCSQLKRHRTRT